MSEVKHMALPWALGAESGDEQAQVIAADGSHIAYVECDPVAANAELIVRAVNAHEAITEAARGLLMQVADLREQVRKLRMFAQSDGQLKQAGGMQFIMDTLRIGPLQEALALAGAAPAPMESASPRAQKG